MSIQPYIPIDAIQIRQRKRGTDPQRVTALAESIQAIGLVNPVTLSVDNLLIAGLHRVAACQQLGWNEIPYTVMAGDALTIELAEIDENLIRANLTELESAVQLARRKEIYLLQHPETLPTAVRGGPGRGYKSGAISDEQIVSLPFVEEQKTTATIAVVFPAPSFSQDATQKLGIAERTIRHKTQIGTALAPVADRLADTPIADSQKDLLALARIKDTVTRAQVVEQLVSGKAETTHQAKAQVEHARVAALPVAPPKATKILLWHGDFSVLVHNIADSSVDLIITDPPYNISHDRTYTFSGRSDISQDFGAWDTMTNAAYRTHLKEWCAQFARILKSGGAGYCFIADEHLSTLWEALVASGVTVKTSLVWHKTNPGTQVHHTTYRSACEYIVYFVKGTATTFNWQGENQMHNFIEAPICGGNERLKGEDGTTLHPTQKPERIIDHLMTISAPQGGIVFDGFMGTGTVPAVAQRHALSCIGIEQDATFFAAAQRRVLAGAA